MDSLPASIVSVPALLRGVVASSLVAGVALADPDDLTSGSVQALDGSGLALGSLNPLAEPPVTFASFGDYGNGSPLQAAVADVVNGWDADFIVTLGDNNYGSLSPDPAGFASGKTDWSVKIGAFYGQYMLGRVDGRYPDQTSPVQRFFPSVGNHDSSEDPLGNYSTGGNGGTIGGYLAYFMENPGGAPRLPTDRGAVHTNDVSYYALRKGPVDIFVLDSDAIHLPGLIDPQKAWLSARLAESTARWKIAIFHQPPYTSSFRGGAAWMRWTELMGVHAILTGHDHFYERLVFGEGGPALFVSGAGGQPTYDRGPAVPESRFFRSQNSALRVTASQSGLKFECRGPRPADGEEELIESYLLGEDSFGDSEDAYSFYAEAGTKFIVKTRTPAPVDAPPLDPRVEIANAAGTVVGSAAAGMPDGRNVWLEWTADATGPHRLTVLPEGLGKGNYVLEVTPVVAPGGFAAWQTAAFPAGGAASQPLADPDADGLANVLEYALGRSPVTRTMDPPVSLVATEAGATLTFDVPAPLPLDVCLKLEMSTDLAPDRWIIAGTRTPLSDWTSPGAVTTELLPGGTRRRVSLSVPASPSVTKRFFRLRAVVN